MQIGNSFRNYVTEYVVNFFCNVFLCTEADYNL